MIKRLFFLSFVMGAIGVPYMISSSSNWLASVKSRFRDDGAKQDTQTTTQADAAPSAAFGSAQAGGASPGSGVPEFPQTPSKPKFIEGAPAQDLSEVLRFDGTPSWVMARWPRVTTGLAQPDLQGYRVPLVTGTAESDLAGSLTYYFDNQQQVKFITFHGVTGDPRKIVGLVVQKYGFRPEQTDDPSLALYLVKWNGKPISELRVQTAPVLRADQPNARYKVDLAMKRP